MEDEKLIELVRKYEFLYNVLHPKYMDNVKKDIAWKEIGGQLKQTAIACKQRWQCLRDAYRRALNKKKRKSGQATRASKPWKYENEMAFVVPFFTERKTRDSIEITSDNELSDKGEENHETESTVSETSTAAIEYDNTPTNVGDANNVITLEEVSEKKSRALKRKAIQSESTASALLMAKLLQDQNKPKYDELDRFFLNVSDTVKKFSPYEQALVKNKIFCLVSEMELQQFAPRNSTPYALHVSTQSAGSSAPPLVTNSGNWKLEP